jgi:hypothetical protein
MLFYILIIIIIVFLLFWTVINYSSFLNKNLFNFIGNNNHGHSEISEEFKKNNYGIVRLHDSDFIESGLSKIIVAQNGFSLKEKATEDIYYYFPQKWRASDNWLIKEKEKYYVPYGHFLIKKGTFYEITKLKTESEIIFYKIINEHVHK